MAQFVRQSGSRGVTLLEVIVAVAIFAVAFTGIASSFISSMRLSSLTAKEQLAYNGAFNQLANVTDAQTQDYIDTKNKNQIYTGINAAICKYQQPENNVFTVDGLPLVKGDAQAGQILLYLNESQVPVELGGDGAAAGAKTINGFRFGPCDLNGDGDTLDNLSTATAGSYDTLVLPVEVRIRFADTGSTVTRRRFKVLNLYHATYYASQSSPSTDPASDPTSTPSDDAAAAEAAAKAEADAAAAAAAADADAQAKAAAEAAAAQAAADAKAAADAAAAKAAADAAAAQAAADAAAAQAAADAAAAKAAADAAAAKAAADAAAAQAAADAAAAQAAADAAAAAKKKKKKKGH